MGDINWLKSTIRLNIYELNLFQTLQGGSILNSPRRLIAKAKKKS